MIADEVMAGAGRTGKFLAARHTPDGMPDLIVLAKGIGAGYTPLGIMLAPAAMVDQLAKMTGYPYGHTAAANPLSCAIGLAALEETLERDLIGNAERVGQYLQDRLWALADDVPVIGDVQGQGLSACHRSGCQPRHQGTFPPGHQRAGHDPPAWPSTTASPSMAGAPTTVSSATAIMTSPPLITTRDQVDDMVERFGRRLEGFRDEAVRLGAKVA